MKKTLSIALGVLILSTVFIACGKKAETQTTPSPEKSQVTAVEVKTADSTVTPVKVADSKTQVATPLTTKNEVVFTLANPAEPASLDPALIQGVPEHRIYETLFEGLVAIDPETGLAIPGLAKSWEANADGTQYTFHLRKTTWSDGVPITANDVVYSWLRELAPETASPYSWFPSMFLKGAKEYSTGEGSAANVGIHALDDYTFQMDLIGPISYAIDALQHYAFAVVPQHAIEKFGEKWTAPENLVCNGPFVLKERVPQSYLSFVPNEKYWDRANVKIDKLIILSSDDANTNYSMFVNGEVDSIVDVPSDKLADAQMQDSYQVHAALGTYYYQFNVDRAPLNNVLVRKAIQYAIDRDSLVEGVTKAGQIPAWGVTTPLANYAALPFPYNSEEEAVQMAQDFLAEAGYPNGVGFPTLTLLYNTSEDHKKVAEFVQQELKNKLGITLILENEEWGTYLDDKNAGNFDICRIGWFGDYQDPNTFLNLFLTGAAMNGGNYSNDVYDSLINEAATILSPKDRLGVLRTAEDILVNEDAAIMPLYYYVTTNMIDTNKWGGWYPNTMDFHPPKDIYLK
ncbi:MAG: peptide ABC transporter substrate-binding protein [Spirochaetaceae bacterium]|nr:peptide ABC transporter substrate-binding protein [Spirochaetaceae bacterium]